MNNKKTTKTNTNRTITTNDSILFSYGLKITSKNANVTVKN
jgi:hypothetical protein